MKSIVSFFCICCVLGIAMSRAEQRESSESKLVPRIDSAVTAIAEKGWSGVILVARKGRVVLHRAYDRQGKHVDTSLAFWVASLTKPFTAAAVLKLEQEGKLSLKDPITKYFENVPADKKLITIHHLLTHTWGASSQNTVEGVTDREKAIQMILKEKLQRPIGKDWLYSNEGYILAAAIIEKVSGMNWEKYLRRNLFEAAGMYHSGFIGEKHNTLTPIADLPDSARFQPFYKKLYRDGKPIPNWAGKGASGVFTTTSDLLCWLEAIRNHKVLAEESWKKILSPQFLIQADGDKEIHYGYGWFLEVRGGTVVKMRTNGRGDYVHDGYLVLMPNGDEIVVLGYDLGPNRNPLFVEVAQGIGRILEAQL